MMTPSNFQLGDRVVCIEPGKTSLEAGRVYVVEYADEGGVKLVDRPWAWYDATRFRYTAELTKEKHE